MVAVADGQKAQTDGIYSGRSCKAYLRMSLEQAIIAWNHNTVVLAFRGTNSMTNVRHDAKVRPDHGSESAHTQTLNLKVSYEMFILHSLLLCQPMKAHLGLFGTLSSDIV